MQNGQHTTPWSQVAAWRAAQLESGAWPVAPAYTHPSGYFAMPTDSAGGGGGGMPRSATLMCMPQLQKKQPVAAGATAGAQPAGGGSIATQGTATAGASAGYSGILEQQRQWWSALTAKLY